MTAPVEPSRYIRATDWARILAALSLPASALPADVIASLEAKTNRDRAQAERDARSRAINDCRRCDPSGWLLDADGLPEDPARRCDHGAPPSGDPPRSFSEPIHDPADTEENR